MVTPMASAGVGISWQRAGDGSKPASACGVGDGFFGGHFKDVVIVRGSDMADPEQAERAYQPGDYLLIAPLDGSGQPERIMPTYVEYWGGDPKAAIWVFLLPAVSSRYQPAEAATDGWLNGTDYPSGTADNPAADPSRGVRVAPAAAATSAGFSLCYWFGCCTPDDCRADESHADESRADDAPHR